MGNQPYAELKLYYGLYHCNPSDIPNPTVGISEEDTRKLMVGRTRRMEELVRSHLNDSNLIKIPFNSLVRNEAAAARIIEYAASTIGNTSDLVRLIDFSGRNIRFKRVLRLDNWKKNRQQELINKLKGSQYTPIPDVIRRMEEIIMEENKVDLEEAQRIMEKKHKLVIESEYEKFNLDEKWKEHLSFYPKEDTS